MNIFNRPPAIAEDSLHYFLHLGHLSSNRSDALALATCFKSHVASNLLPGHMWHRDSFELNVAIDGKGEHNLEGTMRVGDSVDDEWCVVWLLKEISRHWDIAIRVYDSDGEFLLIEAADSLPSWITPENAENRVWIYQGHLHIIPLDFSSESKGVHTDEDEDDEYIEEAQADTISLLEAVRIVRDPTVNTLAAPEIEHAALERTKRYPEAARQHVHRTKAYLPREVALALLESPELVQKAVETFYTRDALQMRAAARMARFSPADSVLATVKLTRTAYAQLMSQKFYPPKAFGIWKDPEGSVERRRKDIGMKIACGFEMIYQETKGRDQSVPEADANTVQALRDDHNYQQYSKKLEDLGFFDATRSPDDLKLREIRCAGDYIQELSSRESFRPSFRSQADAAITRARNRMNPEEKIQFASEEEDSDQWLSDAEHILEGIISKHTDMTMSDNKLLAENEDTIASDQATQLRRLAKEVENFVEGEGDTQGALFDDDRSVSDGGSDDDESLANSAKELNTMTSERNALLESLVEPVDPSEYGKMPASYYTSSQKVQELVPEAQNSEHVGVPPDASSSKLENASGKVKFMRPLLFPQDKFDGVVDSDDESEVDTEDEEEKPALVGDIEIDMNNEQEEFIEFSREILGITPDQWSSIIKDRQNRGVFVPQVTSTSTTNLEGEKAQYPSKEEPEGSMQHGGPKLNSFEAVMDALDAELRRIKERKGDLEEGAGNPNPLQARFQGEMTEDLDIDEEMANELKTMMPENGETEQMDYTLIKNFLESFKSQQGLSGPVSNLIGRLGWQLPRDTS